MHAMKKFKFGIAALALYQLSNRPILDNVRMTGPVIGASFRW
jgi:hypothetical protein